MTLRKIRQCKEVHGSKRGPQAACDSSSVAHALSHLQPWTGRHWQTRQAHMSTVHNSASKTGLVRIKRYGRQTRYLKNIR